MVSYSPLPDVSQHALIMFWTLLAVVTTLLSIIPSSYAIWPIPKTLQTGTTALKLDASGFKVTTNLHAPADLTRAIQRTTTHLQNDKMERLVVGGGSVDKPTISSKKVKTISELKLSLTKGATVRSIADEAILPLEQRDEAYALHVPGDGSPATLSANTTLGLLRGLTTFEQLWYFVDGEVYTLEAPMDIVDWPSYVSLLCRFFV